MAPIVARPCLKILDLCVAARLESGTHHFVALRFAIAVQMYRLAILSVALAFAGSGAAAQGPAQLNVGDMAPDLTR
jgi:hypothetical protein